VPLKLFMFYVGGDCGNSNIELHDVRFSLGTNPQACYDDLRAQWWGIPSSLHIDSWAEISQVDGYDVILSQDPFLGAEKLFFLNLGGYTGADFEEVHKNVLVVATSQRVAIQKSVQAQTEWKLPHKDALMNLERAVLLSEKFKEQGLYVHLIQSGEIRPQTFTSKYTRLNLRTSSEI
jgi:hypothetical protein